VICAVKITLGRACCEFPGSSGNPQNNRKNRKVKKLPRCQNPNKLRTRPYSGKTHFSQPRFSLTPKWSASTKNRDQHHSNAKPLNPSLSLSILVQRSFSHPTSHRPVFTWQRISWNYAARLSHIFS